MTFLNIALPSLVALATVVLALHRLPQPKAIRVQVRKR